jgi:hypothetical protein
VKSASDSKVPGFGMLNEFVEKCKPGKPGKGDAWKTLGLALLVIYILVSQIVVPAFNKGTKDAATSAIDLVSIAQSNVQRIAKLEAVVYKLENIPLFVATQTEAIATLKTSVDKLGEKLDRHISREVK